MRRLSLAAATCAALILTACTQANSTEPSEASTPPATADKQQVGPNGPWVQDLWLYERVQTVDAAGGLVDLTDDIISGLREPTASVPLPFDAVFHVYDDLRASMVTADGDTRADISVVAGLLEHDGERALAALGTPAPDAREPIGSADRVELDVTFLGSKLKPGDPLLVDFAFLQARPAPDEDAGAGVELLAERLAGQRGYYLGVEVDGNIEVSSFTNVLGAAVAGSTRLGIPGKGPISDPALDGIKDGLTSCIGKTSIKCVKNYFKKAGEGAQKSNDLLNCNLGSCDDPPPPPPPSLPTPCFSINCDDPPGKVRGDPHLRTFDGAALSMQGVGEYVLTRGGSLEVQIRTAPLNPRSRTASAVSMVAITDGHDRVVINVDRHVPQVWLNDTEMSYDPSENSIGQVSQGNLVIQRDSRSVVVITADGAAVMVDRSFSNWLDATIYLPPGQQGLAGLLGDRDGDPSNDLRSRNGRILDPNTRGRSFYTDFADTWRVSQEESLLRYAPGETSQTFTDLTFPDEATPLTGPSAELLRRAEVICRAAGVVDPQLLAECAFDYAVSGEIGFVESAQAAATIQGRWAELVSQRITAGPEKTTDAPSADPTVNPWHATASAYPEGAVFTHFCPSNGSFSRVWGGNDGVYTADSSMCTAAVHAGLITVEQGGQIRVTRTPGLDDYGSGTERNGVRTSSWQRSWDGSFTLSR